jgi:hypothetical protein
VERDVGDLTYGRLMRSSLAADPFDVGIEVCERAKGCKVPNAGREAMRTLWGRRIR